MMFRSLAHIIIHAFLFPPVRESIVKIEFEDSPMTKTLFFPSRIPYVVVLRSRNFYILVMCNSLRDHLRLGNPRTAHRQRLGIIIITLALGLNQ